MMLQRSHLQCFHFDSVTVVCVIICSLLLTTAALPAYRPACNPALENFTFTPLNGTEFVLEHCYAPTTRILINFPTTPCHNVHVRLRNVTLYKGIEWNCLKSVPYQNLSIWIHQSTITSAEIMLGQLIAGAVNVTVIIEDSFLNLTRVDAQRQPGMIVFLDRAPNVPDAAIRQVLLRMRGCRVYRNSWPYNTITNGAVLSTYAKHVSDVEGSFEDCHFTFIENRSDSLIAPFSRVESQLSLAGFRLALTRCTVHLTIPLAEASTWNTLIFFYNTGSESTSRISLELSNSTVWMLLPKAKSGVANYFALLWIPTTKMQHLGLRVVNHSRIEMLSRAQISAVLYTPSQSSVVTDSSIVIEQSLVLVESSGTTCVMYLLGSVARNLSIVVRTSSVRLLAGLEGLDSPTAVPFYLAATTVLQSNIALHDSEFLCSFLLDTRSSITHASIVYGAYAMTETTIQLVRVDVQILTQAGPSGLMPTEVAASLQMVGVNFLRDGSHIWIQQSHLAIRSTGWALQRWFGLVGIESFLNNDTQVTLQENVVEFAASVGVLGFVRIGTGTGQRVWQSERFLVRVENSRLLVSEFVNPSSVLFVILRQVTLSSATLRISNCSIGGAALLSSLDVPLPKLASLVAPEMLCVVAILENAFQGLFFSIVLSDLLLTNYTPLCMRDNTWERGAASSAWTVTLEHSIVQFVAFATAASASSSGTALRQRQPEVFPRAQRNQFLGTWRVRNVTVRNASSLFAPLPLPDIVIAANNGNDLPSFSFGADYSGHVEVFGCIRFDERWMSRDDIFGARQTLVSVRQRALVPSSAAADNDDGDEEQRLRMPQCQLSVTETPTVYEAVGQRVAFGGIGDPIQSGWLLGGLLTTAATGVGSVGSLQRSVALQRAALCAGDEALESEVDVATSPLQWHAGDSPGGWLRGAVIGNLILLCGITSFHVLLTYVLYRVGLTPTTTPEPRASSTRPSSQWSFRDACALTAFPGLLLPLYAALAPPLVGSAVSLFRSSTGRDAALAAFAIALGNAPMIGLCRLVCCRRSRFPAIARKALRSRRPKEIPFLLRLLWDLLHFLTAKRWTWGSRPPPSSDRRRRSTSQHSPTDHRHFVVLFGELFEPYRASYHWWAVVEIGSALVGSMASGLLLDSDESCIGIQWGNLAIAALMVLGLLVCRPYDARLDFLLALGGSASALAMSISIVTNASGDAQGEILLAQVVMSMIGLGIWLVDVLLRLLEHGSGRLRRLTYFLSTHVSWFKNRHRRQSEDNATSSSNEDSNSESEHTPKRRKKRHAPQLITPAASQLVNQEGSPQKDLVMNPAARRADPRRAEAHLARLVRLICEIQAKKATVL